MKPEQIYIPTAIYFGRDIWQESIKEIENILRGNVMIVTTGRTLARLGYIADLKKNLEECQKVKRVVIYDKVSANPRLSEAKQGIEAAIENKIDVVIGFGGGSAIDLAKAVAARTGTKALIEEYLYDGMEPGEGTLPVIAIPTTAGTGSELSKAAIITDDIKKMKVGIRGKRLFPQVAIVDSIFTESVPFHRTMETGFDVVAHAMESYISVAASQYTRMQSEYALKLAGQMLPRLAANLGDREARSQMSYASMMMGINLGNASTGLPHRLQYPLGAYTDTSHGWGLAALYPAWLAYEYEYNREGMEHLVSILAGRIIQGKQNCIHTMGQFIASLKLPSSLKAVDRTMLQDMIDTVTGNLLNDPASQEPDIVRKIYEKAWEET
jgi:alcohol dehydrogenase class IV